MADPASERHERIEALRRLREAQIGLAFSGGAPRCMSLSPESETPCRLPDNPAFHDRGHDGWFSATTSIGWPVTDEERAEWERHA